jgi:hypothetical protein
MTEIRPMGFTSLGIIDLFGILTPGVFLFGNIILILYGIDRLPLGMLKDPFLAIVLIFFGGYLLGSILRLVHPKWVDSLVSLYLRKIRRDKKWAEEKFPYFYWLLKEKYVKEQNVLSEVSKLILKESGRENIKDYSKKETTSFFNYCKLLIRAKSSPLSEEIHRMEALVRMLSGVFWASVVGFCGFVMVLILKSTFLTPTNEFTYLILSVVYLIIILAILERFRFIRFKEVMTVWWSFYLLSKEKLT